MANPFIKFICTLCGHRDTPCEHFIEREELKELRELAKFVRGALCEIIHILNRPQSATLRLQGNTPFLIGAKMPATIQVGGTASSLFQEWTGPNGTGSVVPNAGPVTFSSDNPAVATVDPSSGLATGVSAGTANISGMDSVNNLTASDVLTVNPAPPPPAVSATLTLTAT